MARTSKRIVKLVAGQLQDPNTPVKYRPGIAAALADRKVTKCKAKSKPRKKAA